MKLMCRLMLTCEESMRLSSTKLLLRWLNLKGLLSWIHPMVTLDSIKTVGQSLTTMHGAKFIGYKHMM